MIYVATLLVILLIIAGLPVYLSFAAGSFFYMIITGTSMGSVVSTAFYSLDSYSLLALPLFMIAGSLMEISGIAEKLVNLADALLKNVKGGLAATIPLASMFFGAVSGSGTATVAAMSTILTDRLVEGGWDRRYIAALLAVSGPLGFMIPPNVNAILYALVANCSVTDLFMATLIPGIIWGLTFILINRIIYKDWYNPDQAVSKLKNDVNMQEVSYFSNLFNAIRSAIPALIMPIIILGGIYGGIFNATEAGAVACLYAVIVGVLIYKRVKQKDMAKVFISQGNSLGTLLIILPFASVFTRLLVVNRVPEMVANTMMSISSNSSIQILLMVIIFIIAGFFFSPGVLTFVLTPLFIPTAKIIGLDLVQLGAILFAAIAIGNVTPPMAFYLFVACKASKVTVPEIIKPLAIFTVFGSLPIMLLIAYWPSFTLWLPRLLR